TNRKLLLLVLPLLLVLVTPSAHAVVYDVSADGSTGYDLSGAMDLAEAGDTVSLSDGTYDQPIVSVRDGTDGSPITVTGGPGAIINGDYGDQNVLIAHSFITLTGFSVQGKIGSAGTSSDYIDKCVFVEGTGMSAASPLDGFVMEGLTVENCGGECVRLKYFVVNALVKDNTIENCGIHDYGFDSDRKNGEGVYIGTSSDQWSDNGPDECTDNVVTGNKISTSGNECVDIKEGATRNIIEYNTCSDQLDEESACYDSRGDDNTFRYNSGTRCLGAGVRLGGWEVDGYQYGVGNDVYGNSFTEVSRGALKVMEWPQGDICSNTCEGGDCSLRG
ncbi:unnamed protein product, partial [Pylaiella littoralis]